MISREYPSSDSEAHSGSSRWSTLACVILSDLSKWQPEAAPRQRHIVLSARL